MGTFKLNDSFKKKIEKECQEKAINLAKEAREKLTNQYITLLDWYYAVISPKEMFMMFHIMRGHLIYINLHIGIMKIPIILAFVVG